MLLSVVQKASLDPLSRRLLAEDEDMSQSNTDIVAEDDAPYTLLEDTTFVAASFDAPFGVHSLPIYI
jgi:hypothetical protein